MDERIEFFQAFADTIDGPESNIQVFVDDGRDIRDGLVGVVHGADARTVDRHRMRAWIKYADKTRRKILVEAKRAS